MLRVSLKRKTNKKSLKVILHKVMMINLQKTKKFEMYKDLIGCNIKALRGTNQKVRQKNKLTS